MQGRKSYQYVLLQHLPSRVLPPNAEYGSRAHMLMHLLNIDASGNVERFSVTLEILMNNHEKQILQSHFCAYE